MRHFYFFSPILPFLCSQINAEHQNWNENKSYELEMRHFWVILKQYAMQLEVAEAAAIFPLKLTKSNPFYYNTSRETLVLL